jgi:hypothetical protein
MNGGPRLYRCRSCKERYPASEFGFGLGVGPPIYRVCNDCRRKEEGEEGLPTEEVAHHISEHDDELLPTGEEESWSEARGGAGRVCNCCGRVRPLGEFAFQANGKRGRRCTVCTSLYFKWLYKRKKALREGEQEPPPPDYRPE